MPSTHFDPRGLNIAILHYPISIIDMNRLFGMQMMELGELNVLKKAGVVATLFAKEVIGGHDQLRVIPHLPNDGLLLDIPFYQRFLEQNPRADIYQGNGTPLLALFKPERTIIRFDGVDPMPLTERKGAAETYEQAHYVFVSNSLRNYYLSNYPFLNAEKCHVLYNAVDYRPAPETSSQNGKVRMLFCSRWSHEKGINVFLRALSILQRFTDDYEVLMAGGVHKTSSSSSISDRENRVREKASALKHVKILGYLPHDQLMDLFTEVDLLVFPSIYAEPFGLIPAEAAMSCVPTCAFSVGALPEVVQHQKTGILIPHHKSNVVNAIQLARNLARIIRHKPELRNMGEAARERAVNLFNWETYETELFKIYQKVLQN